MWLWSKIAMNSPQNDPASPGTAPEPLPGSASACTLCDLPLAREARVVALVGPDGDCGDIVQRLAELGFLPGERVRLLARSLFGDPIAVRISSGTFALRRSEAACVRVESLVVP
jgi:ferrous iron transport protein A